MSKECRKCNVKKELEKFHKHPGMTDGHLHTCKECISLYQKTSDFKKSKAISDDKYRKTKHGAVKKDLARIRYRSSQKGKATMAQYAKTPTNKAQKAKDKRKQVLSGKTKAHYAVQKYLSKQPCEICGSSEKVHGHHEDYSKPLAVVWLCPLHHMGVHAGKISLLGKVWN